MSTEQLSLGVWEVILRVITAVPFNYFHSLGLEKVTVSLIHIVILTKTLLYVAVWSHMNLVYCLSR